MDNFLIAYLAPIFAYLDRRWIRQTVWLIPWPLIVLILTGSITACITIAVLAVIAYLGWFTVGNYFFTAVRAQKLLKQLQLNGEHDFVDVSIQPGFRVSEKFLGTFTKEGFVAGHLDRIPPFHGITSCIKKFTLRTRFRVALVEIDGRKFVRKSYTPCDYKFYRGLRNNIMVKELDISPQLKYISVPDRTLWIEFLDGPSLHDISETTVMSPIEQEKLFRQLNEFHDSLHELGLCNLDLHRGNIIMRSSDNKPLLIDLDEPLLYSTDNILYKLRCRIDRKRLNEQLDLMITRNQQNMTAKKI